MVQSFSDDDADKDCLLRPLARLPLSFLFCDGMRPRRGVKMRCVILVCHSQPPRNWLIATDAGEKV